MSKVYTCGKGPTSLEGNLCLKCSGQYIIHDSPKRTDNRIILVPYADVKPDNLPKYSACPDCPARRPLPTEEPVQE